MVENWIQALVDRRTGGIGIFLNGELVEVCFFFFFEILQILRILDFYQRVQRKFSDVIDVVRDKVGLEKAFGLRRVSMIMGVSGVRVMDVSVMRMLYQLGVRLYEVRDLSSFCVQC